MINTNAVTPDVDVVLLIEIAYVRRNAVTPDTVFPKGVAKRCAGFPTLTGVGWCYPAGNGSDPVEAQGLRIDIKYYEILLNKSQAIRFRFPTAVNTS